MFVFLTNFYSFVLNFKINLMKKIYSLIALVALSSAAIAQTVKVTFRVNMQNVAVGPKGIRIAGDLQADAGIGSNWTPGATGNTLTATGSGYVYSIVS